MSTCLQYQYERNPISSFPSSSHEMDCFRVNYCKNRPQFLQTPIATLFRAFCFFFRVVFFRFREFIHRHALHLGETTSPSTLSSTISKWNTSCNPPLTTTDGFDGSEKVFSIIWDLSCNHTSPESQEIPHQCEEQTAPFFIPTIAYSTCAFMMIEQWYTDGVDIDTFHVNRGDKVAAGLPAGSHFL